MCDFQVVQNDNYSAVFVNHIDTIPLEIIPLGIYRSGEYGIQELCNFSYLFEGSIKYEILSWENREAKDSYSMSIMNNILSQQAGFKHLLK